MAQLRQLDDVFIELVPALYTNDKQQVIQTLLQVTSAVINIGYLNINEISNFGPAFYIYSLLIIQLFLFMSHQIPNIPRDCFCINLHQYFLKSITFRFKVFHHRNMKKLTTNHRSYRNHLVCLSIFLVSKLLLNR